MRRVIIENLIAFAVALAVTVGLVRVLTVLDVHYAKGDRLDISGRAKP